MSAASTRPHRRDKPCWRCGYSLRRISHDSRRCPECGLPVRLSLSDTDSLHLADPDWLRRLALGSALMVIGSVLPAPPLVIPLIEPGLLADPFASVLALSAAAATALLLVACWLIVPPPVYGLWERPSNARFIARIILSALLTYDMLQTCLAVLSNRIGLITALLACVWAVLALIVSLMLHYRLDELLKRHDNRRLRTLNRAAIVFCFIAILSPCVATPILIGLDGSGQSRWVWAGLILICALYCAFWSKVCVTFWRLRQEAAHEWSGE